PPSLHTWRKQRRMGVRTYNDVEGWHKRLNRRANKGNLSFYLLITLLFEEATEVPKQCKLIKEKQFKRYQSKQIRAIQGRLWAAWERYRMKEICTSELLNQRCRFMDLCERLSGMSDCELACI
ncbi:hypothetical protein DPMN_058442, partial [Dreissena polymorpha]